MAVLPDADRKTIWSEFMSELSSERGALGVTKADLRAAFDALDDFMNTNATAINTAIPQPARAALTTAQKARLLMFVVRKRYLSGV